MIAALLMLVLTSVLPVRPVGAQDDEAPPPSLTVTTPYPDVVVDPGTSASFDLLVDAPTARRVELTVQGVPEGWRAVLQGGGFQLDAVTTNPGDPPDVSLEVDTPPDAAEEAVELTVVADDGSTRVTLPLSIRIAEAAGGTVTLSGEFPTLQGPSDATFTFDLTLQNDTPEEVTFSLTAEAPPGWTASARPAGEDQATTATVAGGESTDVDVQVDPPDDVPAGSYPVVVTATGSGREATAELTVDITGNFALRLTTVDERLNATAAVGSPAEVALVVVNEGTAPLQQVALSASPPTGWDVTFDPPEIVELPPGESTQVTATIAPAEDTIVGDYLVPLEVSVPETSASVDIRTTVETSGLVGLLGIALIVVALLLLLAVFRRFGRR